MENSEHRAEHEVSKKEIENIKNNMETIKDTQCTMYGKIEDNRKEVEVELEKLRKDFKNLYNEHFRVRELVLEIKNTVERATDLNTFKLEQLQKVMTDLIESKNTAKTKLIYPLVIASVLGLLGFILGRLI